MTACQLPAWRSDAACAGEPTDLWFSEDFDERARALEICHSCPVRLQCLEHALTHHEDAGIWGGLSERARDRIRYRRRLQAAS